MSTKKKKLLTIYELLSQEQQLNNALCAQLADANELLKSCLIQWAAMDFIHRGKEVIGTDTMSISQELFEYFGLKDPCPKKVFEKFVRGEK